MLRGASGPVKPRIVRHHGEHLCSISDELTGHIGEDRLKTDRHTHPPHRSPQRFVPRAGQNSRLPERDEADLVVPADRHPRRCHRDGDVGRAVLQTAGNDGGACLVRPPSHLDEGPARAEEVQREGGLRQDD